MHGDVRLVVLIGEDFDRLLLEHGHVLRHRVLCFDVIGQLDDVVRILDAQHFEHLPMELTQIIQLRRLLSELQRSLILHHTLRHRGGIRVRHRDNINPTIKVLHPVEVIVRVVVVLLGHIVVDNPSNKTQLALHRSMQAGLHPRHHLHRPLKQG